MKAVRQGKTVVQILEVNQSFWFLLHLKMFGHNKTPQSESEEYHRDWLEWIHGNMWKNIPPSSTCYAQ